MPTHGRTDPLLELKQKSICDDQSVLVLCYGDYLCRSDYRQSKETELPVSAYFVSELEKVYYFGVCSVLYIGNGSYAG